jgi:hypothetical protein
MDTIFGTWKTVKGEWKKPQMPPSKTLLYRKRLQHARDLQRRSYPVPQPLSIYSSYESGSQLNSLLGAKLERNAIGVTLLSIVVS